jgi:polyribonucleotide nucleotidyltransferase
MPFKGPVGAVRIGRIDGEWIVNPTFDESDKSDINLIVAGTKKAVTMIEGESKNISEEDILEAVRIAHENIILICDEQEKFASQIEKPTLEYTSHGKDEDLVKLCNEKYYSEVENLITIKEKKVREDAFNTLVAKAKEELKDEYPDFMTQISAILDDIDGEVVR